MRRLTGTSGNGAMNETRQLRSEAWGRKAWLSVRSDRGDQRIAMKFRLFGTGRLNDVDPLAWFTDVLARIADIPQSRLYELDAPIYGWS